MTIGEKLKGARTNSGYTQEQVAEQIMVSRQTVSNWETGKSLPDIDSVMKLSDLYGMSLDDLLKGDQTMMRKIEKDALQSKKMHKIIAICAGVIVLAGVIELIDTAITNPVVDFIGAALPWVLMGLGVAFACKYFPEEGAQ